MRRRSRSEDSNASQRCCEENRSSSRDQRTHLWWGESRGFRHYRYARLETRVRCTATQRQAAAIIHIACDQWSHGDSGTNVRKEEEKTSGTSINIEEWP